MAIFQIKKSDIFHISAQNIDCGYSLEPPIFCAILSEIRRHHVTSFSLAGIWFYAAHSSAISTYFQQKKMNKCIRMGITTFKFVIWGGKSVVLLSQITFFGSADASPSKEISNRQTAD